MFAAVSTALIAKIFHDSHRQGVSCCESSVGNCCVDCIIGSLLVLQQVTIHCYSEARELVGFVVRRVLSTVSYNTEVIYAS